MPVLVRLCIQSLLSNPISFESLSIGSPPQQPSGHDHIIQHNADQILRMAILDSEFAKRVRAQIHRLLRDPVGQSVHWKQRRPKKEKKRKAKAGKTNTDLDSPVVKRSVITESLASGVQCSQEERKKGGCFVALWCYWRSSGRELTFFVREMT